MLSITVDGQWDSEAVYQDHRGCRFAEICECILAFICHFVLQSHFGTVDKSPICKVSGIANGLSFMHQKAVAHGDLRGVGLQSFLRFWSR